MDRERVKLEAFLGGFWGREKAKGGERRPGKGRTKVEVKQGRRKSAQRKTEKKQEELQNLGVLD